MDEPSLLLRSVVYHFGGGDAFYLSLCLLIACGYGLRSKWPVRRTAALALLGVVWLSLASWPDTLFWLPILIGAIIAVRLGTGLIRQSTRSTLNLYSRSQLGSDLIVITLLMLTVEWQHTFASRPPRIQADSLAVIGDSVTAGLNDDDDTWPQQLARWTSIEIWDASQPGATVKSALQQLQALQGRGSILILEIGGNDMLEGLDPDEFATSLEQLLATAQRQYESLIMVELPLPPFAHAYGSHQRRLAAKYQASLIPKRLFVGVLTAAGSTVDGVHLSDLGQTRMAELIQSILDLTAQQPTHSNYHRIER